MPLLVAFVGMLAVLGATKYLSVYAYNDDLRLHAPAGLTSSSGDVASSDPALPSAAPQPQPRADGNTVAPACSDFHSGHGGMCGYGCLRWSAEHEWDPRRPLASPGGTLDWPATRR